METEKFKGDEVELKFEAAAQPAFDLTSAALDDFYAEGFDSTPWLLMLYDENRMPYSQRINKDAFVDFIKETLKRFPTIGTFDTYLFVLRAIFGLSSEINFTIPSPGILQIDLNASSSLEFDFVAKNELGELDNIVDDLGNQIIFRGIAGIETEYELELLFSEIMPAGITPHINLSFYERFEFIAWEGSNIYEIVDHLGNQIVFNEID